MNKYQDRKYKILPYDPAWQEAFKTEAEKLKQVFGNDTLSVEHIGSTSVLGMAGKSTVDILVLISDLTSAENHRIEMEALGYEYLAGYVTPESRLFRKMENNEVLVNVHIFQPNHPHVKEMLGLRDYLRNHPEEVNAYSKLKQELYKQYPNDYAEYRKQKDVYMAELMKRALST